MAVSKQSFLSSTRKEVRSTPSKLLFSVFSSPRVDLSSSVSAYLTPPTPPPSNSFLPFHPPALPFMFLNLPTYSSSSGLLPVDRLMGWAHSSAAYLSLPYLIFSLQIPGGGAIVATRGCGEET